MDVDTPPRPDAPAPANPRKQWILVALFAFILCVVLPAALLFGFSFIDKHQRPDDRLTMQRERPFALPFTGLRLPHGVAVDAAGSVYVAETRTNQVLKLAAGSSTQTVLPFTDLDLFAGGVINASTARVAVDAEGAVYVTDTGHNRVVKLAAGSSAQTVLPFKGLDDPEGVAVDATGAVYVVDYSNGRVLKLPANSSAQTALPSTGRLGSPSGDVAVDTRGNVYLTVTKGNGRAVGNYLLKLDAGSDTWTALPSVGNEEYVAVDPNGTVYVITSGASGGVMKLAPGSGDWTEIPGAHRFVDAMGLAVDGGGNVYVTDHTGYRAPGGGSWFGVWHPHDDAEGLVVKLPAG